jgi:iron complex transport system substrate-binding protein
VQVRESELLLVPTNKVSVKYFKAGDANSDTLLTVSDVVFLINYLFKGGPAPDPVESGDVDCDGKVSVSDVVYLINYLFKGGPPPR